MGEGVKVHLSDWHLFNPSDRKTYPKMKAPIQVRFDDGELNDGDSRTFFPVTGLLPNSSIKGWRYIKVAIQR
jgi:hypothetical protein